MNWFVARSRCGKSAVLLACCFVLFRPGWVLDQFYPAAVEVPAAAFMQEVETAPEDKRIVFIVQGINLEGEDVRKTISLPLGDPQEPRLRLRAVGLGVTPMGDNLLVSDVAFGSYAKRIGLETGFEIVSVLQPAERPSRVIPAALALLVTAGIGGLQYAGARKLKAAPV